MTIEEKAKAYDEAIKIAKETYNTQPMYRNWLESMFPELQENEIKDMREKLIKAFGSIGKKEWGGVNVKDVIHWLEKQGESYTKKDVDDAYLKGICDAKHELEKQGEQKSTNKAVPKFKIGDYVKNVNDKREPIYEIVYMDKECYICEYRGKERMGDKAVMHFAFDNPYLRLVEQQPIDTYCREHCKCYQLTGRCFADGECQAKRDNDKKLQQKTKETMFDKSDKWSEEDVKTLAKMMFAFKTMVLPSADECNSFIEFLKSIRDKGSLQFAWKPSDEQMGCLSDAIEYYNSFGYPAPKLKELLDDLKKLKEGKI